MTTLQTPLTTTSVLNSSGTATIGKLNIYDSSAAGITVTLPALSGLNVGARLAVCKYVGGTSPTNNVQINAAATDYFEDGVSTGVALRLIGERREFEVISVGGTKRWHIVSGDPIIYRADRPRCESIRDINGNINLNIGATASAVNYLNVYNAATGGTPSISAVGSDNDIYLGIGPKGAGATYIADGGGRAVAWFRGNSTNTNINQLNFYNAATGTAPQVNASGTDTDVSLNLTTKGAGTVQANGVPVVTTTGTQAVSNKDLTSTTNSFPTTVGRLVANTLQGDTSTEAGANTWAKVMTISSGTNAYVDGEFLLSCQHSGSAAKTTTLIAVYYRVGGSNSTPYISVDILASNSDGTLIASDSFKAINNGWNSTSELWVKKVGNYSSLNFYELSRNISAGVTATYSTNSAWQSAVPTGSAHNYASSGQISFNAPVVTTTGTQTLTNKTLANPSKTVGGAWRPSAYLSGNYYWANQTSPVTATGNVLTSGQVRVFPWVVTDTVSVTKLFAEFTVAGDANSVLRLGIWNDDGYGRPSTLLLDAGTISTGTGNAGTVSTGGTPGVYEITVSQSLSPGLYWVGGVAQGVTTTAPTVICVPSSSCEIFTGPLGTTLPASGTGNGGYYANSVTGALGDLTSTRAFPVGFSPRVGFKVA